MAILGILVILAQASGRIVEAGNWPSLTLMLAHGLTPILSVSDLAQSIVWFRKLGWEQAWVWGHRLRRNHLDTTQPSMPR